MAMTGRYIRSDSLSNLAVIDTKEQIVLAVRMINPSGAAAHVQLFDAAATSAVTLGTTVPLWTVSADTVRSSDGDGLPTNGLKFTTGIVGAVTTTPTGSTTAAAHVRVCIL